MSIESDDEKFIKNLLHAQLLIESDENTLETEIQAKTTKKVTSLPQVRRKYKNGKSKTIQAKYGKAEETRDLKFHELHFRSVNSELVMPTKTRP